MSTKTDGASSGITMGAAFAIVLSWDAYHSFWWTVLHGILGWIYVVYYFLIANYDAVLAVSP